jgi:hypothetical protein
MEPRGILSRGITLLLAAAALHAPLSAATATFRFVGQCTDCTGSGTGTLVLQDYTLGENLTAGNFVSFTYSSNKLSYTVNASQVQLLIGSLPANLPAPANVDFEKSDLSIEFLSSVSGFWCSGSNCFGDFGSTSTWSLVSTPPAIPAVTDWELAALAVALAVLGAWLVVHSADETPSSYMTLKALAPDRLTRSPGVADWGHSYWPQPPLPGRRKPRWAGSRAASEINEVGTHAFQGHGSLRPVSGT